MAENEHGPKRNPAYEFFARMEIEREGIARAKREILTTESVRETAERQNTPRSVPIIEPLKGTGSCGTWPELESLPTEEKRRWQCRALWHINATAFLLHGYRPNESISPPDHRSLKGTYDDLRIAIRAHELQQNPKGELRQDEVLRWATERHDLYPNFPFAGTMQTAVAEVAKMLALTEENTRLKDDLRDARAEARRLSEQVERWQADALGAADRADTRGRAINLLTDELAQAKAATAFLDPQLAGERYAPKLAAAVKAWRAVVDPNGKHPRTALEDWLTQNAAELELLKADGTPNKGGIEEIAKVANWRMEGGAPKTPTKSAP